MARATKPPKRNTWANAVSGSPDKVEAVYVDTGFPAPGGTPVKPPRGNVNFEFGRYDNAINYLSQRGISDWDTNETDYGTFDLARGSDGKVYMLIGTATPGTAPTADLTNWHMVLRDPRPMTGETPADPTDVRYNAAGRPVQGLDAFGLRTGRIITFEENWHDATRAIAGAIQTGSGAFFGPWKYKLVNPPGGTDLIRIVGAEDPVSKPYGAYAGISQVGVPSGGSAALLEYAFPVAFFNQTPVAFDCHFTLNGSTPLQLTSSLALGLGDGSLFGGASTDTINSGSAVPKGAYLMKEAGGNLFGAMSRPPSGSPTAFGTATAAARDTHFHYKCVAVGENDSADGNPHVYHFVNGTLIVTHNVSMATWTPTPFIRITADGGPETCFLNVGRMRVQVKFGEGNILL